jgi:hypothetical protein
MKAVGVCDAGALASINRDKCEVWLVKMARLPQLVYDIVAFVTLSK